MTSYANPDGSFFNEVAGLPLRVVAPDTGATVTMKAADRALFVNNETTLAELTIKLPRGLSPREKVVVFARSSITALTVQDGAGAAVSGAPAAAAALTKYEFIFATRALGFLYTPTSGGASLDGLNATVAEINAVADSSARLVNATAATLLVTQALHDGKTIRLARSGGIAVTLPAATASGMRLRFVVGTVSTTGYVISSVVGTDLMEGNLLMVCDAGDSVEGFESGATDDTITLNGTTTGGAAIGDWLELEDLSATGWFVRGVLTGTGDEVTPFSDAVA